MTSPPGADEGEGISQKGGWNLAAGRDVTVREVSLNLFTRFAAGWLPLLISLALICFAASIWPGGPNRQYVLFALLTVMAVGFACACFVTGGRSNRQAFLTIASLICCIGAFASLQYVIHTGEVPAGIRVEGTQPLVGRTHAPLTLVMPSPAPEDRRDRLRLRLTVVDDDSATGTCVPDLGFTVTAGTSGVTPQTYETEKAADIVEFDLRGNTGTVRFTFTLHSEDYCVMRLVQANGTLHS